MGNLQKKCRTTRQKTLAYRGKSGQDSGNDFLALRLGVVLYLLKKHFPPKLHRKFHHQTSLRGSGLWRALQKDANCQPFSATVQIAPSTMRKIQEIREKTPTPKTRFSIWTLLRTPGRFTTRPLPVHFTTKMSVVRPFSVLGKDKTGSLVKRAVLLARLKSWGWGSFSPFQDLQEIW